MIEKYWLGPTPAGESCAQVGDDNYGVLAYAETTAYKNQLYRLLKENFKNIPESFRFKVSREEHDLGSYYEVVAMFDSNDPDAKTCHDIAIFIDNNVPEEWDDRAREELHVLHDLHSSD